MQTKLSQQRLVKSWIAEAAQPYAVVPREHLRTVFHIQTEQTPRYSQRDFSKKLSRNGLEPERKRAPTASRDASAVYGLVIEWAVSQEDRQILIDGYFEDTDQRLLA